MRHQNKCENKNVNFLSSPGIGTGRVNKKINFLGERDLKSKFLSSFFIIPIIWLFLRYTQTCFLVFICIHGFIVFPTHEVVNLKKILFEGARTKTENIFLFPLITQPTFTFSSKTIENPEQYAKSVESWQLSSTKTQMSSFWCL